MIYDVLMLLLTLSCLVAFTTALVVFINDITSPSHRWLASLLVFGGLWSLIINFQNVNLSIEYNLWIVRATFVMAVLMTVCMLYFAKSIGNIRFPHAVNGLIIISTTLITVLIISGVMLPEITVRGSSIGVERTATYFILAAYMLACSVGAVSLLVWTRNKLKQKHSNSTKQLDVVIGGLIAGVIVGVCTNMALPNITGSIFPARFAWIAVLIWTTFLTFALVRFRFMDIKFAAVRTSAYLLTLMTLVVVYYVMAYFASRLFFNNDVMLVSPISIVLALILTIIFQPVKKFFDRATNSIFYQDELNFDNFYSKFNHLLASSVDLRSILQRAATEIVTTLKSDEGYFFIYYSSNGNTQHYLSAGTDKYKRFLPADADSLEELVLDYKDKVVIVRTLLEEDSRLNKLLKKYKIDLLMPLRHDNKIIGYLSLGPRMVGRYTQRDVDLVAATSNSLIIAIQNSLSVHTVKELNLTLQQRIDEATEELRKSNIELQQLDTAKDEFLSIASHQLRTPLTSVKGYISMLLDGDAGRTSESQRYLLSEAFKGSERMVGLINDFLNVSRIQSGKFMLDYKKFDIVELVRLETDSLKTLAKSRDLSINFSANVDVCMVEADENKIRQIIMNYIDNAIYYSRSQSTIEVSVFVRGNKVELKVKDSGIGVPASEQSKLFTKFFRAANARKQRPDGTGVGIYLAKRIISEHNGKLIFESVEGKGSTFGFVIPRQMKPKSD